MYMHLKKPFTSGVASALKKKIHFHAFYREHVLLFKMNTPCLINLIYLFGRAM